MKISDFISRLTALKDQHGDLPVYTEYDGQDYVGADARHETHIEWTTPEGLAGAGNKHVLPERLVIS